MNKLDFSYDPDTDVLTVEGIQFSGIFFRRLAGTDPGPQLLSEGDSFQIVKRQDGALTVQKILE